MVNKILVAIDIEHRDSAVRALKQAKLLAEACDAEIHVCFVLAYGFYDYVKPFLVEEVLKDTIANVKVELVGVIRQAGLSDEFVSRHVLKGGVHQQILLLAEKLKPAYIVLNGHSPDATSGVTGPVTAHIARLAPCNLLIVK
ncbi:Nucleotide-binding universal stress protein, UspA family [Cohaesibacter sp. ES.047]|uniref:universal stress protein n=1 Tax=Cohaesibacter sp. ES.047 TaxID=1798205 RepID=UPI000BB9B231|nr:universal stress protein [Cohaesibacter sp. ES.047]SNY89946.1 Nucleotide-binding universal stress protein, UspA family [Cohaesibacter sp. ES.047]